ncbi:CLUMA_CG010636, isoform A [Clunio marinus]|uniref:CLUMA_CG010636, isoform A n=1 Tax=Clunio marinus TaxID=568069 RepID=A0A1J1IAF5_9DIPT|nr:CLUMA_CG010636, isoform A [Clunio marinus]
MHNLCEHASHKAQNVTRRATNGSDQVQAISSHTRSLFWLALKRTSKRDSFIFLNHQLNVIGLWTMQQLN